MVSRLLEISDCKDSVPIVFRDVWGFIVLSPSTLHSLQQSYVACIVADHIVPFFFCLATSCSCLKCSLSISSEETLSFRNGTFSQWMLKAAFVLCQTSMLHVEGGRVSLQCTLPSNLSPSSVDLFCD